MKFYGELGYGLETNWSHFGDDPHHYPDPGVHHDPDPGKTATILLCWCSAEVCALWVLLVCHMKPIQTTHRTTESIQTWSIENKWSKFQIQIFVNSGVARINNGTKLSIIQNFHQSSLILNREQNWRVADKNNMHAINSVYICRAAVLE